MLYRVDYVLAVILAGAIAGAFVGRRTSHTAPAQWLCSYALALSPQSGP